MTPSRDPFAHMAAQLSNQKPTGAAAILPLLRSSKRPLTAFEVGEAVGLQSDVARRRLQEMVRAGVVKRTPRRIGRRSLPAIYEAIEGAEAAPVLMMRAEAEATILRMLRETDKPLTMQQFVDATGLRFQTVRTYVRGLKNAGQVAETKRYGATGGTLPSLYEAA